MLSTPGGLNKSHPSASTTVVADPWTAAATTPTQHHVHNLERLNQVFQRNVFDTTGANDDVLKLLLSCCKTLVGSCLAQHAEVNRTTQNLSFVAAMEGRVRSCHHQAAEMSEAVKRVNFLWAAQGLGDFALQTHSRVMSADGRGGSSGFDLSSPVPKVQPVSMTGQQLPLPSHSHKKMTVPKKPLQQAAPYEMLLPGGGGISPSSQAFPSTSTGDNLPSPVPYPTTGDAVAVEMEQGGAQKVGKATHISSRPGEGQSSGIGHDVMNAQALEEALRKSLETGVKLDSHMQDLQNRSTNAAQDERLATIERAAEGIYRTQCQIQTEQSGIAEQVAKLQQNFHNLEHRVSIHMQQLEKLNTFVVEKDATNKEEIHRCKQRTGQTEEILGNVKKHLVTVTEQCHAMAKDVQNLREEKPGVNEVKGLVAKGVVSGMKGLNEDVQGMYSILDINKQEVRALLQESAKQQTMQSSPLSTEQQHHNKVLPGMKSGSSVQGRLLTAAVTHQHLHGGGGGEKKAADASSLPLTPQDCLKIAHEGLPFKTILTAISKLNDGVKQLKNTQQVLTQRATQIAPPLLGLELQDTTSEGGGGGGPRVSRVFEGLPAKLAGIQEGDYIVAVQGITVHDRVGFSQALDFVYKGGNEGSNNVCDKAEVYIRRKERLMQIMLPLVSRG